MKFRKAMVTLMAAAALSATGATMSQVSAASTSSKISANKSNTSDLLKQIKAANAQVIKLDSQINAKNKAIDSAQKDITKTSAKIDSLTGEISKAQTEVTNRKAVMKKQLVSLQKQAGSSVSGNVYVDFVLNSKNLSDMVSRTFTVNKLNQANKDALNAVNSAKTKLANLKTEQEDKKAELVSTKAKLEDDKSSLVSLKSTASDKQKALNKQISDNRGALKSLQSEFASETAKVAQLSSSSAAGTGSHASATTLASGSGNHANFSSSGNTYPWGQCTWYVKQVAPWAGNNWGNGNQWGASAAAAGFTVNHTPSVGSIVSFAGGQMVGNWAADGSYGHVAYVVAVHGNSITIQQGGMGFSNPTGPNTQTIGNARAFTYIHR